MHPMACTDLALCTDTVWKHKSTPDDLNKGRKRAVQHEHGDGSMLAMLQIMNKKRCTVAAPGMYIRPHLSIPACNGRTYLPGPGFSIKHRIRFHTCDPAFKDVPVSAAAVPSKGIVKLKMTKHWHRSSQKEQFMELPCLCNNGIALHFFVHQFYATCNHPWTHTPAMHQHGQGYDEFCWVMLKVLSKFPGTGLYRQYHPAIIPLAAQGGIQPHNSLVSPKAASLIQRLSSSRGFGSLEVTLNRLTQIEACIWVWVMWL